MKQLYQILMLTFLIVFIDTCGMNCQECFSNTLKCLKCQENYVLIDGRNQCIEINSFKQNQESIQNQVKKNTIFQNNLKIDQPKESQEFTFKKKQVKSSRLLQENTFCIKYNNQKGLCQQCLNGHYLNEKTCIPLPKNCLQFDINFNQCLSCADQLELDFSGNCLDNHCTLYQYGSDKCFECSDGFIVNKNNNCVQNVNYVQQVQNKNQHCSKINNENKQCQQCQSGFYLNDDKSCIILPEGCLVFDNNQKQCTNCSQKYYLNENKVCIALPSACVQININTNKCSICYEKYYLSQQKSCIILPEGCVTFDSASNKCAQCNYKYHLDRNNKCQMNPIIEITDPFCKLLQNGKCAECSQRYYYSESSGKCLSVSTLCKSYDSLSGQCLDCYPGYTLNFLNGACVISRLFNCKTQVSISKCVQCYQGFYLNSLNSSQCQVVNPLCKTYNASGGQCLSCYPGYKLVSDQCKIFVPDPYCKKFDENDKCIQCYAKYYLKSTGGNCTQVSPLCKGFNNITGACTDCYQGYSLTSLGACQISTFKSIQNCKVQQKQMCITCADNYFFSKNNTCQQRNPLCKTFNATNGYCTSCYQGYTLQDNSDCIISKVLSTNSSNNNTDTNCKTALSSKICSVCYSGYFVKNGRCQKSSLNCKTLNSSSGYCQTCYNGYILFNNSCLLLADIANAINQISAPNAN